MNAPDPRVSKTCIIFAEPFGAAGYGWGWQAGAKRCKALFRYFYECVQDARRNGYAVDYAEVADALKKARRRGN
jgi:hypothetical protein